jgi:hypothetical protein
MDSSIIKNENSNIIVYFRIYELRAIYSMPQNFGYILMHRNLTETIQNSLTSFNIKWKNDIGQRKYLYKSKFKPGDGICL